MVKDRDKEAEWQRRRMTNSQKGDKSKIITETLKDLEGLRHRENDIIDLTIFGETDLKK